MSFTQLRGARQSKSPKSYVSASSAGPVPAAESTSATSSTSLQATAPTGAQEVTLTRTSGNDSTVVDTEGLYAALPATLRVRRTDAAGRGVYTSVDVRAGTVLVVTAPHISVLSTAHLDAHCSACARPTPELDSVSASSNSSGYELKRCTRCRVVWYCSTACQKYDWTMHKLECKALQSWAAAAPAPSSSAASASTSNSGDEEHVAVPSDAVRCIARMLWCRQKPGAESVWAREVDAMHSHPSSVLAPAAVEAHTHLAHALVRYMGLSSPADLAPFGISSARALVDVLSRFATNTITLSSPALAPVGLAVAPAVALFNHTCDPRAAVVFPFAGNVSSSGASANAEQNACAPLMHVVAIRDMRAGEEVTTAYIDTTLPRAQRRAALRETYAFECVCPLCAPPPVPSTGTGEAVPDPREAMWCPKACGGTGPLPTDEHPATRCSRCKAQVPPPAAAALRDAIRLGQEALDKATALQLSDPARAQRLTAHMLPLLTAGGLVLAAHPLLALSRLHLSLLLAALPTALVGESTAAQMALDEAVRAAARAGAGLEQALPTGHPVRALALAELGRLLAVDEPAPAALFPAVARTAPVDGGGEEAQRPAFPPSGPARVRLAMETLVRAQAELLVAFGLATEGGEVGQVVRTTLVGLEREVGVWARGVRDVRETM